MRDSIQTFCSEIGESACYALCIMNIADNFNHQELPVVETLMRAIDDKFIYYNWLNKNDDNNFTVLKPAEWLSQLTGRKWTVRKESPDYLWGEDEWIVQRWERQMTGKTIGHFRMSGWDPLYDSQTVKFGKIASLRVFKYTHLFNEDK